MADIDFAIRSDAIAATIPSETTLIRLLGYTSPGVGGAEYVEVVNSGTLLAWEFQSNAGTRRWRLNARCPTPQMFGAAADGVTNDVTVFRNADAYCALKNIPLFIPEGAYFFGNAFCGSNNDANPLYVPKAHWFGAGMDRTIINLTQNNSTTPFRFIQNNQAFRARPRSYVDPVYPPFAINDAVAGQAHVDLTTIAEVSNFAVGDIIHVAGGITAQDADDPLWLYDQLHEIKRIDATLGRLFLTEGIDFPLTSGGWDGPGAGKNLAIDWAAGQTITAGDYRWASDTSHWLAKISGTTAGASLQTDTGVTWRQVTSPQVALKGTRDGRPVIVKQNDAVRNIRWADMTFRVTSVPSTSSTFLLRACLNMTFDRVRFSDGWVYVSDAARNINFNECHFDPGYESANGNRTPLTVYTSRKVKLNNCQVMAGGSGTTGDRNAFVSLEAHGEVIAVNTTFSIQDTASAAHHGAYIDRGEFHMIGGEMHGVQEPVRYIQPLFEEERYFLHASIADARLVMSGRGFRYKGRNAAQLFGGRNRFLIYDGYNSGGWVQKTNYLMGPMRLIHLPVTITPVAAQTNALIEFDRTAALAMGVDLLNDDFVALGLIALWNSPSGNDVSLSLVARHATLATNRSLIAITGGNGLTLTTAAPYGEKLGGTGETHRVMQGGLERPVLTYTSGAAVGGTISAVMVALTSARLLGS